MLDIKKGFDLSNKQPFKLFSHEVSPEVILSLAASEEVSFHFSESGEDVTLLRLFNKKTNGFYVDVGAYRPKKISNTYILHHYFGWTGINIDASKKSIEMFNRERPNDINLHTAVGELNTEGEYWLFNAPGTNTLSKSNVKRQIEKGRKIVDKEIVKIKPLSDIFDEYLPDGQTIDLLDIDVEGLDYQALKSNDWNKYRPKIILIEDYSIKREGIENSEIYPYLKEIGYKFCSHLYDTSVYAEEEFITKELKNTASNKVDKSRLKGILASKSFKKNSKNYRRAESLAKSHPLVQELLNQVNLQNEIGLNFSNLLEKIELGWNYRLKAEVIQGDLNKEQFKSENLSQQVLDISQEKNQLLEMVKESNEKYYALIDEIRISQGKAQELESENWRLNSINEKLNRELNKEIKFKQLSNEKELKLVNQISLMEDHLQVEQEKYQDLLVREEELKRLCDSLKEDLSMEKDEKQKLLNTINDFDFQVNELLEDLALIFQQIEEMSSKKVFLRKELLKAYNIVSNESNKNIEYLEEKKELLSELELVNLKLEKEQKTTKSLERQIEKVKKEFDLRESKQTLDYKIKVNKDLEMKKRKEEVKLKDIRHKIRKAEKQTRKYKQLYSVIKGSRSWRITAPARKIGRFVKEIIKEN